MDGGTLNINRRLLSLIGRRHPEIFDVIPRAGQRAGLNPQPLPPRAFGELAAAELLRVGWLGDRLGIDLSSIFDELDDWCPTWPKPPKLPPIVWPPPEPEPHPDWIRDYHLGFATRLAAAQDIGGSKLGDAALDRSIASLEASLSAEGTN